MVQRVGEDEVAVEVGLEPLQGGGAIHAQRLHDLIIVEADDGGKVDARDQRQLVPGQPLGPADGREHQPFDGWDVQYLDARIDGADKYVPELHDSSLGPGVGM